MNTNNNTLNMPFDESQEATLAYDYSTNRADGTVTGATFVAGKNGNAIAFSGNDYCSINKTPIDLSNDFTIMAWVQPGEVETGTPTKLIWTINFDGVNNFIEMPVAATPGSWYHVALVKCADTFEMYVNTTLIHREVNMDTPIGISLNQDCFMYDYGVGLLDDLKAFDVAMTQAEIIDEIANLRELTYTVDGVDFRDFGVYVSGSDGIMNRPKLKPFASVSWDNYHGESVDLMHKFYEPREITLSCFIKAKSRVEFINRINRFQDVFNQKGLQRLCINVHPVKPLIYEVYCKDAIEVSKEWDDDLMVGTFKLKLTEPEPVKKVLKHMVVDEATKTCAISIMSRKYVNIYWGDGTVDYDVCGDNNLCLAAHAYNENGDYYPVVTGCIDEITSFSTNAIIVWDKI